MSKPKLAKPRGLIPHIKLLTLGDRHRLAAFIGPAPTFGVAHVLVVIHRALEPTKK